MSKRNRNRAKKGYGFFEANYWQSAAYNQRVYAKNLDMLVSIALSRFRWIGLPESCDSRFFEWQLLRNGIATLCHEQDMPDTWQTLIAAPYGEFNAYGIPTQWRAIGYNGTTQYNVNEANGGLCFYSMSRNNPWNALELFARKLTHYERTEDSNLFNQVHPVIFIAEQEKKLELENIINQVAGYECAIVGNKSIGNLIDDIKVLDMKTPMICEELARGWQNVLNEYLLWAGVPHLAFEKGERMIEDEARANSAPTNLALLNCLDARRQFAQQMNSRFGLELDCVFNDDFESYNFNYLNNIESLAQDGLLGGESDGMQLPR